MDCFNFIISWKYWKSGFSDCLVSWKYWKFDFSNFLVAWKYWRSGFSDCLVSWKYGRRAGGSRGCVVLPWIIFGTCFLEFPDILEILEIFPTSLRLGFRFELERSDLTSLTHSSRHLLNQPINNQPTNQSTIKHSINQSINQLTNQSIKQPTN